MEENKIYKLTDKKNKNSFDIPAMKTIDKVKQLLTEHLDLRDNRKFLIVSMFMDEGLTLKESILIAANFTKAASIVRASCRLQQTNPELRGKNYQSRVNKAEQERVKEVLGYSTPRVDYNKLGSINSDVIKETGEKLIHNGKDITDEFIDYNGYTLGKIVDDGKGGFRVQFKKNE